MKTFSKLLALLVLAALPADALANAGTQEENAPREESTLRKLEREVTAVVEKVRPSVVQVIALFAVDPAQPSESLALSGIVYSKEGYILTDASGVESAAEVRVAVGARVLKAQHIASDRRTGVAVLKVAAENLAPAAFAPAPCRPGATAIAVGNSYGTPGSAACGTVGGVGRTVVVAGRRYDDMIQMTTPVQPGDCGGFVADSSGRFLGLIHSVYAPDRAEAEDSSPLQRFKKNPKDLLPAAGQGVSFATPAEWVRFSADRIIKHGRMVRGWLGLSARPLDDAARAQLGLREGEGAEIIRVDREGPAKKAQLARSDVLLEFDGQPVKDLEALQWKVARVEQLTTVKVVYLRNRERREGDLQIEIDPQK